ncbi:glutamine amidotransferase [Herbaspirillum sp. YR522]|uniref:glutamine amidotransferase n=1 Tax=Herbaspirillum sp. YR522 TaxID=1144342 RepID=UPI00026FAB16|nr:glutamine amidotransferase [Herbaspirillum sp. YR522]EJN02812.1 GMP synthase family protein [Herbaspirillum sp. YR522]
MKTAIALRHIHFEDVGSFDTVLAEHGYALHYVDPATDDISGTALQQADLLIVLGGPIGVADQETYPFLAREMAVIGQRLAAGRPLLGICLGAQLIASALGARVYPMQAKEIGFSPLALTPAGRASVLSALGETPVLHWHGDQFDIAPGASRLAGTPACPNQAFALGPNVLGLQFHLEAEVDKLERWLVGHASELAQAGIDPRVLRQDAARWGERLGSAARKVLTAWLRQLDDAAAA